MRISIALATYNPGAYLLEQLDSIAGQNRLPDELVISDDQSTDNTSDVVAAFAAKAPFPVHYVVNRERGILKNFDNAFLHCTGEVIAPCDQDDVWHPDKLARIEKVFSESSCHVGLVFSDSEIVDENLNPLGYTLWEMAKFTPQQQRAVTQGNALNVLLKHNVVAGHALAFRGDFKDLILPLPPVGLHDKWTALLIAAVADVAIISEPLVKHRQHGNNVWGAKKRPLPERLAVPSKGISDFYDDAFELFRLAVDRLADGKKYGCSDQVCSRIRQKMVHLQARARLPASRFRRLPIVTRELLSGRYFAYSSGVLSFAADLVKG